MLKAIQVAKLAALSSIALLAVTLTVFVLRVSSEVTGAVGHLRLAAARAERLAAMYETELSSDKNRKAIEAGIAAAASWQATARLVNTTTIPAINRTLGELEATGRQLAALVEEQNGNLTRTLGNVDGVAQESQHSIKRIGDATEQLGQAGRKLGEQIDAIGTDTQSAVIALTGTVEEAQRGVRAMSDSAERLREIGENLSEASRSAPGIAQGIEKVASKAPWYQKLAAYGGLLVGIGSLVWR